MTFANRILDAAFFFSILDSGSFRIIEDRIIIDSNDGVPCISNIDEFAVEGSINVHVNANINNFEWFILKLAYAIMFYSAETQALFGSSAMQKEDYGLQTDYTPDIFEVVYDVLNFKPNVRSVYKNYINDLARKVKDFASSERKIFIFKNAEYCQIEVIAEIICLIIKESILENPYRFHFNLEDKQKSEESFTVTTKELSIRSSDFEKMTSSVYPFIAIENCFFAITERVEALRSGTYRVYYTSSLNSHLKAGRNRMIAHYSEHLIEILSKYDNNNIENTIVSLRISAKLASFIKSEMSVNN